MSQEAPRSQVVEKAGIPPVPQPSHSGYPCYNGFSQPLDYNRETSKFLGIAHIAIGITCIFLNSLLLSVHVGNYKSYFIGYGVWGGTLFIAVGVLQMVLAKRNLSTTLIITTMVMSIVAACVIPFVVLLSTFDIYLAWRMKAHLGYEGYEGYEGYDITKKNVCTSELMNSLTVQDCTALLEKSADTRLALGSMMIILAFMEIGLLIATSALCCNAVCCRKTSGAVNKDGNLVVYYQNKSGHQAVVLQNVQVPENKLGPQNEENIQ